MGLLRIPLSCLLLLYACSQQYLDVGKQVAGVKKASLRLPKWVTIKNATLYQLDVSGRMVGFPVDASEEVVVFEENIMDPLGPWSEVRRVVIDSATGARTLSTRHFAPTGQLQ